MDSRTPSHSPSVDPTVRAGGPPAVPTPGAAPSSAARYGKFECVEKLGQGGGGEVWKARDTELDRWVALKFLLGSDADEIARFEREAQTAGRLSHPGIAAIHEVGRAQGRHFIAMQFVEGLTLKSVPRNDRRRLVKLVLDAAQAVHHAHLQGIVHRDLKPENVMVAASDHVYVMDFGLARTADAAGISASGTIVGTPAYMPPEQARGERVDARADVYALGATLYELLTDHRPFQGSNVMAVLKAVTDDDAKPPRRIDPTIDSDLETIVLKCLEKDRARRYATAGDFAADLSRWLAGEPISARPISGVERFARRVRRNRALTAAIAAVVLVAAGAAAVVGLQGRRAEEKQRRSEEQLKRLSALWMAIVERKQDLRRLKVPVERARPALEEAVRAIDAFVAENPEMAQGWYLRARGNLYLGLHDAAEEDARRAVALAPDSAAPRALLGLILLENAYRMAFSFWDEEGDIQARRKDLLLRGSTELEAAQRLAGSSSAWGFAETSEDQVSRNVAIALHRFLADDRSGAEAALKQALAERRSEEYLVWMGSVAAAGADAWYSEAVKEAPGYAWAWFLRAIARMKERRHEAAMQDFDEALRLQPADVMALSARGDCRAAMEDYAGALRDYDAALTLAPRLIPGLFSRGRARARAGDVEGALADYAEALRISPRHIGAHVHRGNARQAAGDFDGAIRDYESAMAIDPKCLGAYVNRANIRSMRKDVDGAMMDFAEAIRLRPDDPVAWGNRGSLKSTLGDFAGAVQDFTTALSLNGDPALLYFHRGSARRSAGDLAGSLLDLNEAIRLAPRDPRARFSRGMTHRMLEDLRSAISDFDEALRIAPASDVYVNRALARAAIRDIEGAMRDLEEADRLQPRQAVVYGTRGHLKARAGDLSGAISDFTEAMRLEPGNAKHAYDRGNAKRASGDMDGALADYTAAVKLDPAHSDAWCNRGNVRRRAGQHREAIADYDEALRQDGRNGNAYYNRALSRESLGDLDGAIADCDAVLRLQPRDAQAFVMRAELKRKKGGDLPGVVADLESALKVAPADWPHREAVERMLARAKAGQDE